MKKIYLGLFSIGFASLASAQVNKTIVSVKQSRTDNFAIQTGTPAPSERAGGDILWSNDFTTTADWTPGTNVGHTGGAWTITATMPANLASQAAQYGFPSAMNSASGGNFAIINSDAAGASATQNAWIETSASIAVATILTTAGSPLNTPLNLKFTEIYRHFYDENYVEISNDGGATWTTIRVNPVSEVPVNTNSGNPEIEIVNITAANGGGNWTDNVKVRFLYKGNYDWFWGIDDVQLIEAFANDVKINTVYQATDVTSTEGLDYYTIPVSQTSFPGVTFGAKVFNNGGAAQSNVTLNVSSGSYNESSSAISLAVGATDTVSVTTPYMIPAAIGSSTVNIITNLGTTDGDPSNNQKSLTFKRDEFLYARDNGTATGGIAQVSSQDGSPLSIGNLMEVFDPMTVTGVQIRLLNQTTAVGQTVSGIVELYDASAGEFVTLGETDPHTIVTADLATFVTIPLIVNVDLNAGDLILVMAHHEGGADEVGFGYAQPTGQGTVLGYTADGERFQLTDPNAIMIRVSSQAPNSISENAVSVNTSIYPNPAAGQTTIDLNGTKASAISVIDITGKVVYASNVVENTSIITLNTSTFASGVYSVNITTEKGAVTKRLIVKN